MKKLTLLFSILYCLTGLSQNRVIIPVSNTVIADTLMVEANMKKALERKLNHKVEIFDEKEAEKPVVLTKMNSLVAAVHFGFSHHRPVVLSPDIFWLTLLQGFAIHITTNSDSLKKALLIDHANTAILVKNDELVRGKSNQWPETIGALVDSTCKNVNQKYFDIFNSTYSTTDKNTNLAYKITFLNSVDDYFDYSAQTACGIPYIVLEGKPEDWAQLNQNVKKMYGYGLDNWVGKMDKLTQNIYRSAIGKSDNAFWKNIYKYNEQSGGNTVTGWIVDMFPYLVSNGENIKFRKNEYISYTLKDSIINLEQNLRHHEWVRGVTGGDFPLGYSQVDLNWIYYNDTLKMNLIAGFFALEQNRQTMELKPIISWCIINKSDTAAIERTQFEIENDFWDFENEIDNFQFSCSSFDWTNNNVDDSPRYRLNNKKNLDYHSFKEFLNDSIGLNYCAKNPQTFKLSFTIDENGQCKDIVLTISEKECEQFKEGIIAILMKKNAWHPAVHDGKKVSFKANYDF